MLDTWRVRQEPYYAPQADETRLFEAAYAARLPVMPAGDGQGPDGLRQETLCRVHGLEAAKATGHRGLVLGRAGRKGIPDGVHGDRRWCLRHRRVHAQRRHGATHRGRRSLRPARQAGLPARRLQ